MSDQGRVLLVKGGVLSNVDDPDTENTEGIQRREDDDIFKDNGRGDEFVDIVPISNISIWIRHC